MTTHWTGTLDLVRTTLTASAPWIAACGAAAPADRIVVGVGGHPWDGTFLVTGGPRALGLPLAQIGLGQPEWMPAGLKRWHRTGEATIDIAMAGTATPAGYTAAVQLAEDLLGVFRTAHEAGTLICDGGLRISGPPLLLPASAPSPFAGAWVFQLTLSWDMNR